MPLAVLAGRAGELNDEEGLFVTGSVRYRDAEKRRADEEQRKTLARLHEVMARQHDRLMSKTKARALNSLRQLSNSNSNLFLAALLIGGCQSLFGGIQPTGFISLSSYGSNLFISPTIVTVAMLIHVTLRYSSLARNWRSGEQSSLSRVLDVVVVSAVPIGGRAYIFYYTLLALSPYILSVVVYYTQ